MNSSEISVETARSRFGRPEILPIVPIPVFLILFLVLAVLDIRTVFEPSWLLPTKNVLFLLVVPLAVVFVATRGYVKSGLFTLLMLGAGMLAYGLGAFMAGYALILGGPNANVTVYNGSALFSAIFHVLGAVLASIGTDPQRDSRRKKLNVTLTYLGTATLPVLLTIAALKDLTPVFFVQSEGPTIWRQIVLAAAIVFFVISGVLFVGLYLFSKTKVLYWYSLALFLIATGLTCVLFQKSVGSPIGWLGRGSQFLGGIYLLVAVVSARKDLRIKGLTIQEGIADLFRHRLAILAEERTSQLRRANQLLFQEIAERKKTEEALRISEAQLSTAVMMAHLGPWEYDVGKDLFTFNDHFYRLLRTTVEQVGGYTMSSAEYARRFVHPDDMSVVGNEIRKSIEATDPDFSQQLDHRVIYADGEIGHNSVRIFLVKDELGRTVRTYGVNQDITERKKAEEILHRLNRELRAISSCNQTLLRAEDEHTLLDEICRIICDEAGYRLAWVGYAENDDAKTIRPMAWAGFDSGYIADAKLSWAEDMERGRGPAGIAIRSGEVVRVQDFSTDPRMAPWRESALQRGYRSGIALPLENESANVFGVLLIYHPEPYAMTSNETQLMESLAGDLAFGISAIRTRNERKRTEEDLRQSEERYRSLVENIDLGIALIGQDFNIRMVNTVMGKWFDKPVSEIIGRQCFREFEKREAVCSHCPGVRTMSTGRPEEVETQGVRDDGTHFDVRIRTFPTRGLDGMTTGFIEVVEDITGRKQTEEALRKSEERLRLAQDAAKAGAWEWDLLTNENSWSEECWSLYGLVPHSCKPSYGTWREVIHPDDREAVEKIVLEASRGRSELNAEWRVNDPKGVERWLMSRGRPVFDADGHVTRYVGIVMDITDRKMAELDLRASEEKYRTLFDNSPLGIISVDTGGRILEVNQPLLDILGSPSREATKAINMLEFPPLVEAGISDAFRSCMATGEKVAKDFPYTSAWGKPSHLRFVLTPVTDRKGMILGCQAIVEDVSKQVNLEKQLRQAQKMEAVGTLAGGIAHDFNNLLQVVLGYSELILADEDLPDRLREDLGKILLSGRNGADLVQRLLTFSRKSELSPLDLDLNQRIRQTHKFLQRTIPKMIDIELILADNLARIHADPTQVDQVLMNISVNARDAMPEGGRLLIETANVVLDEEYVKTHVGARSGEYVLLSVSDTGHGMDKETLDHIFEPFFTTKETGKGTGLGLAMVYGIVKQHDGYITCYSEPGRGTTFRVYLPAAMMATEPDVPASREIPAFGTETILLVDDEEFVRGLGKRILERSGYTVLTASNGKEALDVYTGKEGAISLVILDLIMPGIGGKQCLEELLQINPNARVLITSGFTADGATKGAVAAGARGFVSKPYNMKEMLQAVREVLDSE